MPKATLTVPKAKYDKAVAAVAAGLVLLQEMEKAGALRLPFMGHQATMATMRAVVKK